MARDATQTRAQLVRAGEQRFARDGVAGAKISDIVRDAGQLNDSAVSYHFGSRSGLLAAIVARHMDEMEGQRRLSAESADLIEVVRDVVKPTAELLKTEEGRDFLRIMEQLASFSGVGTGPPNTGQPNTGQPNTGQVNAVLDGTVLQQQLDALAHRLIPLVGKALARERIALLITFLTAALAQRARGRDLGFRQRLGHAAFVEHLSSVLTGALRA